MFRDLNASRTIGPGWLVGALLGACFVQAGCSLSDRATPAKIAADALPGGGAGRRISTPVAKVGLLRLGGHDFRLGPGGSVSIRGYVVSHPSLPADLSVTRNGRELPMLSFRLDLKVSEVSYEWSPLRMAGRGTLRIFYEPQGVNVAKNCDRKGQNPALEIERDDVRFSAEFHWGSRAYFFRIKETAVASLPFQFGDQTLRTPIGRSATDVLIGESDTLLDGLAFASKGLVAASGPVARLDQFFGPASY